MELKNCNPCEPVTLDKDLKCNCISSEEYAETQTDRWHKYPKETPKDNTQYLIAYKFNKDLYYDVARYSNDLYKVDKYEFKNCKNKSGFYKCDSELVFFEIQADYFMEIPQIFA